jgi:beta-mannosidase
MEIRAIEGWTVRAIGDRRHVPSPMRDLVVPMGRGRTVHEALIEAGRLPHPDDPGGEDAQSWIGRTDWCFSAWFRVDRRALGAERVDLAFDWIDTLAEIRINGVRVALSANEFVPLRVSIRAFLRDGANEIDVRVRGPVTAVEALERRLGSRPVNGDWTPFAFLRKSACNFGWDWGPRIATAGLGPVRIEAWSGGRIEAVRPLVTRCDASRAEIDLRVDCERTASAEGRDLLLRCAIGHPDGRWDRREIPLEAASEAIPFAIDDPRRWWPRGHGAQDRYAVIVELVEGAAVLDRWERRVGLRSVELDRTPDAHGEAFAIRVNDRPIWCRGANWIPMGSFPRSEPRERIERWIDAAADAELNMLRVWGGGLYESEDFYECCDERGILVWQDFMFACATYPEDRPYPELVDAEARHQVSRLAAHPSVVLWCGGNENILAWWSWGWRERLAEGQSWGRRYWLETLPAIVAELDPTRPYWPDSPFSGSMERHPNDPDCGDRHTWDAKVEGYRSILPRFCSEFGQQSPPSIGTLRERLGADLGEIGDPELARRQRAWGGDAFQTEPAVRERFRTPRSLEEWILALQILQARAYTIAFEWMRSNAPRCMGALFWQWNDAWRGHSWSVLDVAGRPKPALFAVRRACAPRALALVPGADACDVVLCTAPHERSGSDDDALGEIHARVRAFRVDGSVVGEVTLPLNAAADDRRGWMLRASLPKDFLDRTADEHVLVADVDMRAGRSSDRTARGDAPYATGRLRAMLRRREDRTAGLPEPRYRVDRDEIGDWLVAESMLIDACIQPESEGFANTRARDGMWTLLPGERVLIELSGDARAPKEIERSVRTANGIGAVDDRCGAP